MQRVCFNPLKHWRLQQNKGALFKCVCVRSLPGSTQGVLGYEFTWLHHGFVHSYGKMDRRKHNLLWRSCLGTLWLICKGQSRERTPTRTNNTHLSVIRGHHADPWKRFPAAGCCLKRESKVWLLSVVSEGDYVKIRLTFFILIIHPQLNQCQETLAFHFQPSCLDRIDGSNPFCRNKIWSCDKRKLENNNWEVASREVCVCVYATST